MTYKFEDPNASRDSGLGLVFFLHLNNRLMELREAGPEFFFTCFQFFTLDTCLEAFLHGTAPYGAVGQYRTLRFVTGFTFVAEDLISIELHSVPLLQLPLFKGLSLEFGIVL